jgi:hypothetical protein
MGRGWWWRWGPHSARVQEVIRGCGHEVQVANPRLMEGSKRRKRKNDRIDANQLARLGGVDPESLYPIQHRSRESAAGSGDAASPRCLGGSADGDHQPHPSFGQEHGHAATQGFPPDFAQKGEEAVPVEVREALLPLVGLAATLSADIQGVRQKD